MDEVNLFFYYYFFYYPPAAITVELAWMGRTGTAVSAPQALQVQTVGSVSINVASRSSLIRV